MQAMKTNSHYWLLLILGLNVLSTAIHYFDNYIAFDDYPLPAWITPDGVWIAWLILTAFGGLGYWLYRQHRFWLAYFCLGLYSATGLSTPGHYFYAPFNQFSTKMHAMILSDGSVGMLLLVFVFWSAFVHRPWQNVPSIQ
jgi:hypothetical protein